MNVFSFLLGMYPRGTAGSKGNTVFNFSKNCQTKEAYQSLAGGHLLWQFSTLLLMQHFMGSRPGPTDLPASLCSASRLPPMCLAGAPRMHVSIPRFCQILATPTLCASQNPQNSQLPRPQIRKHAQRHSSEHSRPTGLWSCAVKSSLHEMNKPGVISLLKFM